MDVYLTELVRFLGSQSWQIAILTLVVALATWALRHKTAHVRYLLWLIVLAKCLVPPFVAVPLKILPEGVAFPARPEVPLIAYEGVASEAASRRKAIGELTTIHRPEPAEVRPTVTADTTGGTSLAPWVGLAWGTGALLYLALNLLRGLRGQHVLRRQRRPLPNDLMEDMMAILPPRSWKRLPVAWIVDDIGQPFVWGLLRGNIYVPSRFLEAGDPEHRRHVLAHELSHVLRFDAAVNAIQILAQGLFWFHPFVWWTNRQIRREREKCCDEMAVAQLGTEARAYCHAVVETLARAETSTRPVPSLAVAGPVKNLEERIKTMLTPGKRFHKHPSLIAATTILLAAILTVPTALVLTGRAQTASSEARTDSPQTLHQAAAAGDIEQVQTLLAQGADLNGKDKNGSTPLHEAAGNGWVDVVRLLLEKGANVKAIDASGRTPLHRASRWGSRLICEWFLTKGADVNATDSLRNTPLHASLAGNQVNRHLVEFLLAEGADVNARNEQGETPLHLAGRTERIGAWPGQRAGAAEILLAHGAEVNATDKSGRSPLHVAVEHVQGKTVELLLAKGADIEAKNAAGATALNLAAKNRFWNIVALLVNGGADVNSADSEGLTPLHFAAGAGDTKTVERLIAQGADVNAQDTHGVTPTLWAVSADSRDTVEFLLSKGADTSIQLAAYLGDLTQVKGFIDSGIGVNPQDGYTPSPLQAAAVGDQTEVAEFLLSEGAQVNYADSVGGWTPLHQAAKAGSADAADLLIRNGAEIEAKTKVQGSTPLHLAVSGGDVDMARLLIAHGADVNAKSQSVGYWSGATPLHMAAYSGQKDLVLLLLDHGADINAQKADGMMPTEVAARRSSENHKDVVRLLIDKDADLSNRDVLLFYAGQHQQADLLELLIRQGADVNSRAWGLAPVMAAIWVRNNDAPELAGTLKLLLDNGADPDTKDVAGWSLLHYACSNADLTKLLLDGGANPNIRTRDGDTPLHLVAERGNTAVAQLLISRGADVNAKNSYGFTPLSIAESSDKDRFGEPRETPLTDQVKAAKKEIAKLLSEHGATQ